MPLFGASNESPQHMLLCEIKKKNIEELSSNTPGPSCSKLAMSLVNDSLKFTSSDTQIC